jgi:hypothetical protein
MTNATSGQIGAGQQDPFDATSEFSVIAFIVRQMMALMETMTPVQVVSVTAGSGSPPAAGTVDVQILVSQVDGANNVSKPGIVHGLPYFRLQGGPWAVICDPAVNDFGFIVAASRDTSNVNKTPGVQVPGSFRKYSYSDGIYFGGCLNAVPAATFWLKPDGTFVLTDKIGNVVQSTTSQGIAMTPAGGQPVTINGDLHATGAIIAGFGGADQVGLQTHHHPGNNLPPTPGT